MTVTMRHLVRDTASRPQSDCRNNLVEFVMKNDIYAAIAALALIAATPLTASAADLAATSFDGPRPSSLENWRATTDNTVSDAGITASSVEGPRPSSLDNWPGMTAQTPPVNEPASSPFDGPRPSTAH
jgi:hypothetical protein